MLHAHEPVAFLFLQPSVALWTTKTVRAIEVKLKQNNLRTASKQFWNSFSFISIVRTV